MFLEFAIERVPFFEYHLNFSRLKKQSAKNNELMWFDFLF